MNNHEEISRTVYFRPYDFFVTTNIDKSGREYDDLRNGITPIVLTGLELIKYLIL
ncbi:MAG: hypothetical protein ACTS73_08965 [Arsenophonus sp. NEOnobi-MAG3]